MIEIIISFIFGCIVTGVSMRYGIGLGTRIVNRTQDGLPAFGRDEPPMLQSHTNGIEDVVDEDES